MFVLFIVRSFIFISSLLLLLSAAISSTDNSSSFSQRRESLCLHFWRSKRETRGVHLLCSIKMIRFSTEFVLLLFRHQTQVIVGRRSTNRWSIFDHLITLLMTVCWMCWHRNFRIENQQQNEWDISDHFILRSVESRTHTQRQKWIRFDCHLHHANNPKQIAINYILVCGFRSRGTQNETSKSNVESCSSIQVNVNKRMRDETILQTHSQNDTLRYRSKWVHKFMHAENVEQTKRNHSSASNGMMCDCRTKNRKTG